MGKSDALKKQLPLH